MQKLVKATVATSLLAGSVYGYLSFLSHNNSQQHMNYLKKYSSSWFINMPSLDRKAEQLQLILGANKGSSNSSSQLQYNKKLLVALEIDQICRRHLQTGDVALIRFQTKNSMQASGFLYEWYKKISGFSDYFESAGYIYVDEIAPNSENRKIYILYNQFGKTRVRQFKQFVNLPYIDKVIFYKNADKINKQIQKNVFDSKLREIVKELQDNNADFNKKYISEGTIKMMNRINQRIYGENFEAIASVYQYMNQGNYLTVLTGQERKKLVQK